MVSSCAPAPRGARCLPALAHSRLFLSFLSAFRTAGSPPKSTRGSNSPEMTARRLLAGAGLASSHESTEDSTETARFDRDRSPDWPGGLNALAMGQEGMRGGRRGRGIGRVRCVFVVSVAVEW